MVDLAIWKLCLDGAMVVALSYLGYRVVRSSGVSESNLDYLRELDSSLKRLLKEADRSAAELAQNLSKQRTALEELLFDVETVENRLNKVIDEGQTTRKQLVTALARVKEREVPASLTSEKGVSPSAAVEPGRSNFTYELAEEPFSIADSEPASFGSQETRGFAPPKHQRKSAAETQPAPALNIYGEPIVSQQNREPLREESTPARPVVSSPLRNSIVKEVIPSPAPQAAEALEDIYAAAEELLSTGKSLEQVAAITRLPVEEVRMLSQVIETESEPSQLAVSSDDARLGVLSKGIRRERQVL